MKLFRIPLNLLLQWEEMEIITKKETNKSMLDETCKYCPKFKKIKNNG